MVMSKNKAAIPDRSFPGLTSSALSAPHQGGSDKSVTDGTDRKRRKGEDSSDDDSCSALISWPRFLVISPASPDRPIGRNPFLINKAIQGLVGQPKNITRMRSGDILVETTKKSQADNLLRLKTLANTAIVVNPHRGLNSSKGVIRDHTGEMDGCSEEEIVEGMANQGVIHVRRIMVFRDGSRRPTRTYILTFNIPKPPTSVKAGYLNLHVDLYIPYNRGPANRVHDQNSGTKV